MYSLLGATIAQGHYYARMGFGTHTGQVIMGLGNLKSLYYRTYSPIRRTHKKLNPKIRNLMPSTLYIFVFAYKTTTLF